MHLRVGVFLQTKVLRRTLSRSQRETLAFYTFISPWIVGFLSLSLAPVVFSFFTSFTRFDGFVSSIKWLGMRNYGQAIRDLDALYGLQRSLLYAVISVPLELAAAFVLALLLNQKIRGRGILGGIYYLPTVIPSVATAWMWRLLMTKNSGLLNAVISLVRPGTAINWLHDYAFQALICVALWSVGSSVIIFLAGLQGVPGEVEEAAMIDGASKLQLFRFVTMPLVTPTMFLQLIMHIIGALQVLQLPILLSEVGSGEGLATMTPRSTYMYSIHAMRQIIVYSRYGYGAALLWIFFAVILLLTLLVFRTQRYWVYYEVVQEGGESR